MIFKSIRHHIIPDRIEVTKALTGFFYAQHCFAGARKARISDLYVL